MMMRRRIVRTALVKTAAPQPCPQKHNSQKTTTTTNKQKPKTVPTYIILCFDSLLGLKGVVEGVGGGGGGGGAVVCFFLDEYQPRRICQQNKNRQLYLRSDQGGGRNSSLVVCWVRCTAWCSVVGSILLWRTFFSGWGNFSLGVSMGSDSIPPKLWMRA